MEVIKPMDFSSFAAFCEHLNRSSTKTANLTSPPPPPPPLLSPPLPPPSTTATAAESSLSEPPTTAAVIEADLPTKLTTTTTTNTNNNNILDTFTKTIIINGFKNETEQVKNLNDEKKENHIIQHNGGNIDFEKMERQGKMEMAAKERESQRLLSIPKKWNRREEYEFLRVLTGYGVDFHPASSMGGALQPDWTKFKQMAHLERKSDETLNDYYKVFIAMCKRQTGVKLTESERGLEGIIEEINEQHARLVLDRLELLSKLREIARHPQLEERLKLCMKNVDTPDWWEAGKHDRELVAAVLKHGLYRSETFIFNDPNYSFAESEKRFIRELEAQIQRSIKLEAFNAKKATSAALIKNEVIDLDADEPEVTPTPAPEPEPAVKAESEVVEVKAEVKAETAEEEKPAAEVAEKVQSAVKEDEPQSEEVKEVAEETATNGVEAQETDKEIEKETESAKESEEAVTENGKTDTETVSEEKTEDKAEESVKEVEKMDVSETTEELNESEKPEVEETPAAVELKESETSVTEEKEATQEVTEKVAEPALESEVVNEKSTEETESVKKSEELADKKEEAVEELPTAVETEEPKEVATESVKPKESTETEVVESVAKETDKKVTVGEEEILDLVAAAGATDPDDDEVMKEKEKAAQEECKKQAAELKARFPDLEVIQPAALKAKQEKPKLEMCMIRWFKDYALERRLGHIISCVENGKWPVDKHYSAFAACKGTVEMSISLHDGIPHLNAKERRSQTPDVITITTEQGLTKHLPTSQMQQVAANAASGGVAATALGLTASLAKAGSAVGLAGLDTNALNAAVAAAAAGNNSALSALLPGLTNPASSLSVNAGNTPTAGKKRKRHIAIDVETERAKLHALLNSSPGMAHKDWEAELSNLDVAAATRRSGSASSASLSSLQPPPAHQHTSLSRQGQFNKPAVPPLKTPPPSAMGAPMDLSSSLPKFTTDMLKSPSSSGSAGAIDLSEAQDFSISKKSSTSAMNLHAALSSAFPSMGGKGGKLDDTLNKLMKRNNCIIEEPVVGKEKKRKKLDEIVLGLSAAKEQKTFPDPSLPSSKKPQIPPSVSVTPANMPTSSNQQSQQNQKPFTITVTTVPGKSSKSNSNSSSSTSAASSNNNNNFAGLQNMSVGGMTAKDSLSAFLAQTMSTDPATFIKQQQKMMQCLPPAQRKLYENMLTEMEQAMKMSTKYDSKVNKWLSDSTMNEQMANMDQYGGSSASSSRRGGGRQQTSSQQQQQQQQQSAQISKSASQAAAHAHQQQQQQQQHQQQQQQHHQQQQQQSSLTGPQGLTGEEPVPVINKQTGKRLSGSKAPVLKRLMQWLTENPNYEVDPKWLEQMQNPMTVPSPKPASTPSSSSMDYNQSSSKSHGGSGGGGGRPSSTSSNASTSSHSQMQQQQQQQQQQSNTQQSSSSSGNSSKKSSRQSAIDQANAAMQFGSLAGINPSLLASLPALGFDPKNPLAGFDPKNPLLSMPFAGMPGMGNIPGLNNLNSMNLFASLAGMGGLGNLASMDANSLAALMAAAGPALSGLGGSTSGSSSGQSGKNNTQTSSSSSKKQKQDAAALNAALNAASGGASAGPSGSGGNNKNNSASQLAGFPFLFPNPSLLYPPMGLGGLNPYSMSSSGLGAAYDQLAQQYNLLNGGATSSSTTTTQSKSHQSQAKSSSSRTSSSNAANAAAAAAASAANLMNVMAGMGGSSQSTQNSTQSGGRSSSRQSAASRAAAQASAEMAQLSNLLMPGADPHLLESISRMTGIDLAQASRLMSSLGGNTTNMTNDKRSSSSSSSQQSAAAAAAAAQAAQEKQAAKEQQKWMESLARGALPSDLLAMQAFSQGKLSSNSGNSGTNNSATASSSSNSKSAKAAAAAAAAAAAHLPQIPGLSGDLSQAFLAEMAAQAMAAAGGQLPLSGPGSLASLTGSLAGLGVPTSSASGSSSSAAAKRQREQEAFKQQMDYYTKTLGLGSGISLIPTSSANNSSGGSGNYGDERPSKRSREMSAKDELAAAALAAGLPLNFGSGMSSIEKSLRSGGSEADKVTLTPLNSAGIAANLPSQTTITIAPPISSGASSSSERSERSESRISLTITNAADAAKLPPPYEEADELIIQPILKKTQQQQQQQQGEDDGSGGNGAGGGDDNRRSSNRLKRPRSSSGANDLSEQPAEKRRELRSTRHTRQSSSNMDSSLNLSASASDAEDKHE